jgi:ribosomal protein S14
MLASKIKDLRERKAFQSLEKSKIIKKFIFFSLLNEDSSKKKLSLLILSSLKLKKISKTRVVRRCILTNRNRGVLRPFGISRIYLRELMQFGLIPGYSKAVW